jgi:putative transposase
VTDAYRFIAAEKANYPISLISRVLGVNRTAYHRWEGRAPSQRALQDAFLLERIRQIHRDNRAVYGAPRIHAELRMAQGIKTSRKRVERLMAEAGISGLIAKKRGRTTIRVPGVRVADDLVLREFRPADPTCSGSLTSPTCGWLYLAAVQDAFSRTIVGWAMAEHMRAELVTDALAMEIARRRPETGLIHHSDQGAQYVSLAFGQKARDAGIGVSMGSKGDCFDNSVAESFFATLKKELVHRRSWQTRRELQSAVFDYIETFYNRERRHSTLDYLSPREFEMISLPQQAEEQKVKP